MRRSLPAVVVAAFRDRVHDLSAHDLPGHILMDGRFATLLSSYSVRTWEHHYHWLDSSGLALYFLDRIAQFGFESALPVAVGRRLRQNLADNTARNADTCAEFLRLNSAFTDAGVRFANLKGITLVPQACSNPSLRLQLDLDFLTTPRDAVLCDRILSDKGYIVTAVSVDVWEYKAGASRLASIEDLYKPKPQRSVELHIASTPAAAALLDSREWRTYDGISVPLLSAVDRFLGQTTHLLKHLRGEWLRLSWLLEFRNSVRYWSDHPGFWHSVYAKAASDPELRTSIGAATALATLAFGEFIPAPTQWAVDALDPGMALWIQRYGLEAIMADFPGTKLYLLQPQSAPVADAAPARSRRQTLIPLHKPPLVVRSTAAATRIDRLWGWYAQVKFIGFRLRFHVTQSFRYLIEATRWKRLPGEAQQ